MSGPGSAEIRTLLVHGSVLLETKYHAPYNALMNSGKDGTFCSMTGLTLTTVYSMMVTTEVQELGDQ